MTDTFDWAGLWDWAFRAYLDRQTDHPEARKAAAAYLRTRIEAAFVPRKQPLHCETCGTDVAEVLCAKCGKWWRDNSPEVHEATARAEAAEARVAELTAQLATARVSERAAVKAKQAVLDKIDDVVRSFSDGDGYFLASQIRAHLAAMGEPA